MLSNMNTIIENGNYLKETNIIERNYEGTLVYIDKLVGQSHRQRRYKYLKETKKDGT